MKPCEIFSEIIREPWNTSGDDVQWRTIIASGRPVLAFQGSRSGRDWINNFSFAVKPYKNQVGEFRVHKGYARAWKSCNDDVMENFTALCRLVEARPIITGHSYGGAIAVLAAEDFHFRTGISPEVVTFGAPKVLWGKASVRHLLDCADFACYAQRNDVVPLLPPIPGYSHCDRTLIGKRFNFFRLFNVGNHQKYGNESIDDYPASCG